MLSNVNLSNDLNLLALGGRVTVSSSYFSTRAFSCTSVFSTSSLYCSYYDVLQVVGSRGSIEINPRDTMAKESSIIGVALFCATKVKWNFFFCPFQW